MLDDDDGCLLKEKLALIRRCGRRYFSGNFSSVGGVKCAMFVFCIIYFSNLDTDS